MPEHAKMGNLRRRFPRRVKPVKYKTASAVFFYCLKLGRKKPARMPCRQCDLVSTGGVEPPAYRLGGGRSIHLSYVDKM